MYAHVRNAIKVRTGNITTIPRKFPKILLNLYIISIFSRNVNNALQKVDQLFQRSLIAVLSMNNGPYLSSILRHFNRVPKDSSLDLHNTCRFGKISVGFIILEIVKRNEMILARRKTNSFIFIINFSSDVNFTACVSRFYVKM